MRHRLAGLRLPVGEPEGHGFGSCDGEGARPDLLVLALGGLQLVHTAQAQRRPGPRSRGLPSRRP
eukprot:9207876-Alexandrium_andersonii.AAC.1